MKQPPGFGSRLQWKVLTTKGTKHTKENSISIPSWTFVS
jgi:hypothetical protein